MSAHVQGLAEELESGCGACMIANMRVGSYSIAQLALLYLGLASHLGHVVTQSSSGLRSKSRGYGMPLGKVKAEMTGKTPKDGKQANNYFRLHTDR
ncbi:MAG: hypothetical protein SGPRY_013205, partial [Prymnesium sp.]